MTLRRLARSRLWQVAIGVTVGAAIALAVIPSITRGGRVAYTRGVQKSGRTTEPVTARPVSTTTTTTVTSTEGSTTTTSTSVPVWPPTIAATRLTAPEGWGLTLGPDGNIWYIAGLDVVRATPVGQVTVFSYADVLTHGQGYPAAITTGPDGNLWFTTLNGDMVGRITPSGDITEFDAPASGMIETGSDGALWFNSDNQGIGRITTAGVVTTYRTTGQPQELAEGADGNLWFTETGGLIGRLTPDGVLTEFSAPETNPDDWRAIIAGADGNLWFFGDQQVGRVTTSGLVTQWPAVAATAEDGVGQMARTSDGRIWFVTAPPAGGACDDLAELNPDGSESLWTPLPCIYFSKAITAGPDGNLWLSSGSAADSQGLATIRPPSS